MLIYNFFLYWQCNKPQYDMLMVPFVVLLKQSDDYPVRFSLSSELLSVWNEKLLPMLTEHNVKKGRTVFF